MIEEDKRKEVQAWCKAYEEEYEEYTASAQDDEKTAKFHRQVSMAWSNIAVAYAAATMEGLKDSREAVEAHRKEAKAREEVLAALERGEEEAAELYKQIAKPLGSAGGDYFQAFLEGRDRNTKASIAYYKSAQAYEAQAVALEQGNKEAAELHKQRAEALGGSVFLDPGAAAGYCNAAYQQLYENTNAVEDWLKFSQAREEQAAALIQQMKVLERGDKDRAGLYKQKTKTWGNVANAYLQAVGKRHEGNNKAADAFRKRAQAYEKQAAALEHGDKDSATLHEEIAEVLGGWRNSAATAYTEAAEERAKGNNEAAEAWHKCAQAREAQAEALERGEKEVAELHEKMANVLGDPLWGGFLSQPHPGAAKAYCLAAEERAEGNNERADAWHKCARATEARAAALARGDIAAAKYYCQQACSFG